MQDKEKLSVFEYRRRKAQAEADKCKAQQQIVDLLLAEECRRPYAEDVAEGLLGETVIIGEGVSDTTNKLVNRLLKKVYKLETFAYELDQSTVLY